MIVLLPQQEIVQIRVPRAQNQNHGGAVGLRIADKGIKCLLLLGRKLGKAFHVNAVEGVAGAHGIEQDLILILFAEFLAVQHTAVAALDTGIVIIHIAGNSLKRDLVAFVIRNGRAAANGHIIIHISLKIGRVSQCFPQLYLVGLFVVGFHTENLG